MNICQKDFPLCDDPWQQIGDQIGISGREVLTRFQVLKNKQELSRVGAVVRSGTVGGSTLAAMSVPPERMEEVADYVNTFSEINHNYEREDEMNLWFVVASSSTDRVESTLAEIESHTHIPVFDLRMQQAFHIDLGFEL